MTKTIVAMSCTHTGHRAGLNLPEAHQRPFASPSAWWEAEHNYYAAIQAELYAWYERTIEIVGDVDVLVHLGDMVDGDGRKAGGTEIIENDPQKQAHHAARLLQMWRAKDVVLRYGSPYHTGGCTDYENIVAGEIAETRQITEAGDFSVNGLVINARHWSSRSTIPHGRATPLMKQWLDAEMWALQAQQERPGLYLRGHVHYGLEVYDPGINFRAISVPALQFRSKFGSKQCAGIVNCGIYVLKVDRHGGCTTWPIMCRLTAPKLPALTI